MMDPVYVKRIQDNDNMLARNFDTKDKSFNESKDEIK